MDSTATIAAAPTTSAMARMAQRLGAFAYQLVRCGDPGRKVQSCR